VIVVDIYLTLLRFSPCAHRAGITQQALSRFVLKKKAPSRHNAVIFRELMEKCVQSPQTQCDIIVELTRRWFYVCRWLEYSRKQPKEEPVSESEIGDSTLAASDDKPEETPVAGKGSDTKDSGDRQQQDEEGASSESGSDGSSSSESDREESGKSKSSGDAALDYDSSDMLPVHTLSSLAHRERAPLLTLLKFLLMCPYLQVR
jgi:hypothetical protein